MVIANIIGFVANIFIFIVIADSLVSFFLSPYHPIRETLDRIVNPLLAPIRRVVPLMGMMDFSPLVLIILVEILSRILIYLVSSL
jgi:YggT family protein